MVPKVFKSLKFYCMLNILVSYLSVRIYKVVQILYTLNPLWGLSSINTILTKSLRSLSSTNTILTKSLRSLSSTNNILTKSLRSLSSTNTILTKSPMGLSSSWSIVEGWFWISFLKVTCGLCRDHHPAVGVARSC